MVTYCRKISSINITCKRTNRNIELHKSDAIYININHNSVYYS